MKDKIERIKEIAKSDAKKCGVPYMWECHGEPVVKYSLKLAEVCKADKDVCEIAALLHDVGRWRHGGEDHHLTGSTEAEKILSELGFNKEFVVKVRHCIESHRCNNGNVPNTIEAKIISSADTMAHLDNIPFLFFAVFACSKRNPKEAHEWLYQKILVRGWDKKMLVPEAKEIMKDKYEALKTILDASKEYIEKL